MLRRLVDVGAHRLPRDQVRGDRVAAEGVHDHEIVRACGPRDLEASVAKHEVDVTGGVPHVCEQRRICRDVFDSLIDLEEGERVPRAQVRSEGAGARADHRNTTRAGVVRAGEQITRRPLPAVVGGRRGIE